MWVYWYEIKPRNEGLLVSHCLSALPGKFLIFSYKIVVLAEVLRYRWGLSPQAIPAR